MSERCTVCGQTLPILDLDGESSDHAHTSRRRPTGGSRTAVLAPVAVAILIVIAIAALLNRDDSPAELEPTPESTSPAEEFTLSDPADASVTRSEPVGEILSPTIEELSTLLQEHRIAYLTEGAVVIIDPQTPLPLRELPTRIGGSNDYFSRTSDYELLHDGERTIGITPQPSEAIVLSSSGRLVPDAGGGFAVAADPDGVIDRLLITGGALLLSGLELPAGSTLLPVDNYGVIVSSAVGRSYLAKPGRLEPIGEGLVVAATAKHHVEVRCSDPFSCAHFLVNRESGVELALPTDFIHHGRDIAIAPGGRWLLSNDPQTLDAPRLFDAETLEITQLDIDVPLTASWSPDGVFAVWFPTGTNEALIQVFRPAGQSVLAFDLEPLGAPPRVADAVNIFQ